MTRPKLLPWLTAANLLVAIAGCNDNLTTSRPRHPANDQFQEGDGSWTEAVPVTEVSCPEPTSCELGDWAPSTQISQHVENAFAPRLAVSADAHAVAAWEQPGGDPELVWVAVRSPGSATWQEPESIAAPTVGEAFEPQVAVSGDGHAIVVWGHQTGKGSHLFASLSRPQQAKWEPATKISGQYGGFARVVMDHEGSAIVVWVEDSDESEQLVASRRSAGSGKWEGPTPIFEPTDSIFGLELAIDRGGQVMAIWEEGDLAWPNVMASRYDDSGWNPPVRLDRDADGKVARSPQVVWLGGGQAVAVWAQGDGEGFQILVSHYTEGTGWATPEHLPTPTQNVRTPRLAANCSGDLVMIWHQDDHDTLSLHTSRYSRATSRWTAGELLSDNVDDSLPQVAMDGCGNVTAVWAEQDAVVSRRYGASQHSWHASRTLSQSGVRSLAPSLAVTEHGQAFAIWQQRGPVFEIHGAATTVGRSRTPLE